MLDFRCAIKCATIIINALNLFKKIYISPFNCLVVLFSFRVPGRALHLVSEPKFQHWVLWVCSESIQLDLFT